MDGWINRMIDTWLNGWMASPYCIYLLLSICDMSSSDGKVASQACYLELSLSFLPELDQQVSHALQI